MSKSTAVSPKLLRNGNDVPVDGVDGIEPMRQVCLSVPSS